MELYLDGNELANLSPLPFCAASLRVLSAADNHIQFLQLQLPVLATFKALSFLTLAGNPIDKEANYRQAQTDRARPAEKSLPERRLAFLRLRVCGPSSDASCCAATQT